MEWICVKNGKRQNCQGSKPWKASCNIFLPRELIGAQLNKTSRRLKRREKRKKGDSSNNFETDV